MDHPKGRKGKGRNPFEMDYDPLKPYVETIDEKGEVVRKRPESKTYNMLEMKDEDLEHLFDEDELKLLRKERKRQKELADRDLCKEKQDEEKRKSDELQEKVNKLEANLEKVASLLAQLVKK